MNTLNTVIAFFNCGLSQDVINCILEFIIKVKMVASSNYHTMILAQNGTVFACGKNTFGQLGLGDTTHRYTFTAVPALPKGVVASQVVAGGCHTMILAEDGTVFACGWNALGQLGLGDDDDRLTFTEVTLPEGVVAKQVVGGQRHTIILAEDGTVFACGWNAFGQLCLGDTTNRNTFTPVPALLDGKIVTQVVAGASHTMILVEDGTVFACGKNGDGQLGLGNNTSRKTLTKVSALPNKKVAKQIFAGPDHSMIFTREGTTFVCGGNYDGMFNLGDKNNRDTFTAVPALPEGKVAKQVHAGRCFMTILAEDGTVFTCGSNYHGQLGLGDTKDRKTLTAVPALPEAVVIKQVVAGSYHTMIIAQDGTLFACGGNAPGLLGLGDTMNRSTFAQVPL